MIKVRRRLNRYGSSRIKTDEKEKKKRLSSFLRNCLKAISVIVGALATDLKQEWKLLKKITAAFKYSIKALSFFYCLCIFFFSLPQLKSMA